MSTQSVTPNIQGLPPGATLKPIQGLPPGATLKPISAESTGSESPKSPGLLDLIRNNVNMAQQGAQPGDGMIIGALKNFGAGGADVVHSIGHSLMNLGDTLTPHTQTPSESAEYAKPVGQQFGDAIHQVGTDVSGMLHNPARTAGQLGVGLLAGEAGGAAVRGAGEVGSSLRNAAMGDPDVAALKGLQVGPRSPKTLKTLGAVEGARPYLEGVQNLQDLQTRVPQAKAEIWQPYQDAVDAIGGRQVKGPDGVTTVRELENQRAQLSALNRGLKLNSPEAIQLAQQKGMTAAQLLAQEKAVQAALDPELASTGIDPKLIRKTFGQVSQVGSRVSGKSTLAEAAQPSGFGKIANLSLEHPLQAPGQVLGGLRDLVAGRPMWEAKPTDLGIREGFRIGGPKPEFGTPRPPDLTAPAPLGLHSPAIQLGAPPEVGGTPEGYRPPPFHYDTDAMRTGRLLNPPPIQLGGAVEGTRPPEFHYDTTPMRKGRTLSAGISDDMPLSSYPDIFPDQMPQATRLRPLVNKEPEIINPKKKR